MTQAKKSVATALVGLLVAGGLIAYAWFGVKEKDEKETARKEVTERIFSAASDGKPKDGGTHAELTFVSLEVTAKGETTRLEQQDGHWKIVSPLEASADKFAVEGMVAQLQSAKFKEQLEEKPTDADLEKYGLLHPKLQVVGVAQMPDGTQKTLKVYGGIENTFDGSVYMRREGDPAVYTGEGGLRWSLEKSTFDLRDKEILPLDEAKLTRVALHSGKKELVLERDEKKRWHLKKPLSFQADGNEVSSLLNTLKGERAQAFPQEPLKSLGLEAPKAEATFTKEDGKVFKLRLGTSGRTDAGAGKTYAWVEQEGQAIVAEIGANALSAFEKPPDDLKDKSALSFEKEQVAKVTMKSPGAETVVLERAPSSDGGTHESWQVVAPQKGKAKSFKISSLLWALTGLRASGLGEENPKDWRKLGIDDQAASITLEDAAGKVIATLQKGREVPKKPGQLYARGSRNLVLEVDATRMADLFPKLADLLDAPAPSHADAGFTAQAH